MASQSVSESDGLAEISPELSGLLRNVFNDPQSYGVHQLFNDWWQFAPDTVIEQYHQNLRQMEGFAEFVREGYWAEPLSLSALQTFKEGTLGHAYFHFIVDKNLEAQLALNYKAFHESLIGNGTLNRMPADMAYAVTRGFQVHDFLHVITGYRADGFGETALQAFCLAQMPFPYFAMWMSVITTRIAHLDPGSIHFAMDAICDGWKHGRAAKNLQFEKWEERLSEPLVAIRQEFGIAHGQVPPQ